MATPAAKSKRRAEALNRLDDLAVQVAGRFTVEVPDLRLTNRDPELAQIQQVEATCDLLESILRASGGVEGKSEPESPSEPVEADATADVEAADMPVKTGRKATKKASRKSRRR